MKKIFLLIWSLFFTLSILQGQHIDHSSMDDINEVVTSLYDVISGPAEPRNWKLFHGLFYENATMGATVIDKNGKRMLKSFTPTEYIEGNGKYFEENGFYEEELAREVNIFGGVAQVFTSYQFRFSKNGKIEKRGINCIQLAESAGTWKITNIIWEAESPNNALPDAFVGIGDQIELHNIFSDHMVIQRDKPIHIWGWARPGSSLSVSLAAQQKNVTVNNDGTFSVYLDAMKAGGPFQLKVSGREQVVINDIYLGEVWICGGQSNMEWPVSASNNATEEIANANYPMIRMMTIPKSLSNKKLNDIPDLAWELCTPESVADFSAIGYFFARKLQSELGVAIGLIDNAWGGTNIEGWMSEEAFHSLPEYQGAIQDYKDVEKQSPYKSIEAWREDMIKSDIGMQENWQDPSVSKTDWKDYEISGPWEGKGYQFDGVAWVTKQFNINAPDNGTATLYLGAIDDTDSTYLNGQLIGNTYNVYNKERVYTFPASLLQEHNELTVKIEDYHGGGGFTAPDHKIYLEIGDMRKPLGGTWKIKLGTAGFAPPPANLSANAFPTNRYNAMVHPLTGFALQGEIFYQGESNARQRRDYAPLFKNMILDYREKWDDDEFTFLFVQLANFHAQQEKPVDEDWPHLRLAQADARSLPYVGMTTAIDVGNPDDIHPRDKQTVGMRLADNALAISYGQKKVHEGPEVERILSDGKDVLLQYQNIGDKLISKHGRSTLRAFAVTTDGEQWVWADARLDGRNRVRISDPDGNTIVGIRYAHADNPGELDLYNSNGLPAIPGEWIME